MRLIDADKLLECLDKPNVLTNRLSTEDKETVRNIVKSQPTTYDIDSIVNRPKKEIGEYQKYNYPEDNYEMGFENGCEYAFEKSIETVKNMQIK